MECIEGFLTALPRPIVVVGGSPLCDREFPGGISINGFHGECQIAAINSSRSDTARTRGVCDILQPVRARRRYCDRAILPRDEYPTPSEMPKQPTTCFSLLLICEALALNVELYGVCGWASRHHDGDWEMHWMKTRMKHVAVHDPRPPW